MLWVQVGWVHVLRCFGSCGRRRYAAAWQTAGPTEGEEKRRQQKRRNCKHPRSDKDRIPPAHFNIHLYRGLGGVHGHVETCRWDFSASRDPMFGLAWKFVNARGMQPTNGREAWHSSRTWRGFATTAFTVPS